jgi:UPF0755 protein
MQRRGFRLGLKIVACLMIALGIGLPAGGAYLCFSAGQIAANKTIVIPRGTSIVDIAQILERESIVPSPLLFRGLTRVLAGNALVAGEYQFTPAQSVADMVIMMRDGKSVIRRFTVPEGLTTQEILQMVRTDQALAGPLSLTPAEGALWPETYHYSYGDSRNGLVERMQKAAKESLHEAWKTRDPAVRLKTPAEALIMASLIEKETGKKAEERQRVAGVFYNRLRQDMRLQSDPTVIYGVTQGKTALARDLTKQDLETPTPYNTYTQGGLPPAPICNPGRASLNAALHPESNDFLYFVADGTGGHAFAKDLPTHNKNVARWLKIDRPQ